MRAVLVVPLLRMPTPASIAAMAVLVCFGLVGCDDVARQSPETEDAVASLGPCVPTGPLRTVKQINRFIDSAAGGPDFLGADVGVDVQLPSQRSLWLFADTLRSDQASEALVRNSMLVFSPGCVQVVRPADGGAVIPDRSDRVGYWPMSAWRVGATIYVMLQRVLIDSGLAATTLGPALAVFELGAGGVPVLRRTVDLGSDNPSATAPRWGSAAARHHGWLYLYGTSTRDIRGIHGFALHVARVRTAQVAHLRRWRFWDGERWQADPRRAVRLIPERGGVSAVLSVWSQAGSWYVLSKQDEFLGRSVVVWTSDSPVGPFVSPVQVAELPCNESTGELRYMPLAHPELLPRRGTVVISYSRNYEDLGEICADPTLYRPRFRRVVLPRR